MAADDAARWYADGLRLFSGGQTEAAIGAFRKSLAIRPNDAATWKALGVVYGARGEYALAEQPLHRACLLDAKLADACLYFGRTLYLLDQYAQAVNVLKAVIAADPRNAQAWRIEAMALEASGQSAEAEAAFQQAVGVNASAPLNEDPAIDYGVFLYRQGRPEAALAPLQAAVKRHGEASRAQLELGCTLLALDRVEEAVAHLERATSLDPAGARGHLLLGRAYQRQGKSELARKEFDQGSRTVK
ncbi:MAG TPA: tetratricopeptide repeat protein [Candidatus Sulfopaludibacter sp.]|nr:tetratricopeptide repeat protein [Candidatus Sulfopaludibacter sp.]